MGDAGRAVRVSGRCQSWACWSLCSIRRKWSRSLSQRSKPPWPSQHASFEPINLECTLAPQLSAGASAQTHSAQPVALHFLTTQVPLSSSRRRPGSIPVMGTGLRRCDRISLTRLSGSVPLPSSGSYVGMRTLAVDGAGAVDLFDRVAVRPGPARMANLRPEAPGRSWRAGPLILRVLRRLLYKRATGRLSGLRR